MQDRLPAATDGCFLCSGTLARSELIRSLAKAAVFASTTLVHPRGAPVKKRNKPAGMTPARNPAIGPALLVSTVSGILSAAAQAQDQQSAPVAVPTQLEEVVVTGYRRSLEDAAIAKRENLNFTDTIFAEDIGKFPD